MIEQSMGQETMKKVTPDKAFAPFLETEIEQSVAARFEKQVALYGDRTAVQDSQQSLTYIQFNGFANRIAHSILTERGTSAEQIVLFFEQGVNFLGAIFGVLKTGKCYVPIDPSFPKARNAYILGHSQAQLIVTNTANLTAAQTLATELSIELSTEAAHGTEEKSAQQTTQPCQILNIDDISTRVSAENPDLDVSPEALAYIIYTSGSTGKPKGVFQNNRNLLHNARNQINAFHLGVGDRMPLVHSCSVMGAVRVIYNALLSGTALYPFDVKAQGLNALRSLLTDEKITTFHDVATHFRHFADIIQAADAIPNLRLVILGGEAMARKDVELYKRQFPDNCLLCTGLGSTEAGTIRIFMLDKSIEISTGQVPPGYAVAGKDVRLWDENGEDVPPGEIGEIVIESEYLSLGYWQRNDTNAETFAPIAPGSKVRQFRTGDLGRFLPDGCLVHMGRKDFQVKIRGFRVNVAEIEAALMDSGRLKEVLVVGKENHVGEIALAAYVVPRPSDTSKPTIEDLRSAVKKQLPDYMMPAAFVYLDALPLTPNGKVNRLGLPNPPAAQPVSSAAFVAPNTPTQKRLAIIWQTVLGLPQIGIQDDFFELGGHSLQAAQIVARVQTICHVDLPLSKLFETPTIAGLATEIEKESHQTDSTSDSLSTNQISPRPAGSLTPLSFAQQRLWFLQQLEPDSRAYHVTRTLRLRGPLKLAALQKALTTIVKRHEALRTTFVEVEGVPQQSISSAGPFELPVDDLSSDSLQEQASKLTESLIRSAEKPFNLTRDLLLRAQLIRLSDQEHVLQLVMHHIASDGWSIRVLRKELSILYAAYASGQTNLLASLSVQYADFAQWQRQWLSGKALETQLTYWKEQLADIPPLLALPTDYSRPAQPTYRGEEFTFTVPPSLADSLKQLGKENGTTLFMTMLASFQTLLYRYTQQTDIVVGSPIASRNRPELEGLIGFFANTLALRADFAEQPSFQALLTQVRERCLGAYTHQNLPFEKLVEELQPERNLSYSPIFQVFFSIQESAATADTAAELKIEAVDGEKAGAKNETAKFDLTLSMRSQSNKLQGTLKYNTDLFAAATIERMAGHFQALLGAIAAHPTQPITELSMMTAAESQQILTEWTATAADYDQSQCIHERFEAQVEKTPDAIALTFPDTTLPASTHATQQTLTYRQLNTQANQLAHHLIQQGVQPDSLIGLHIGRSINMIVGLLGILKAGGAYVPLDPNYPQTRLSQMVEDAKLDVLITEPSHLGDLSPSPAKLIALDTDRALISQRKTTNPRTQVSPQNLAYVIYTSGSTGKPKGVMIEHRAVNNLADALQQSVNIYRQGHRLNVSINGSLSFDTSVKQIVQLMRGHTLSIVPDPIRTDGAALLAYLKAQQIDVFDCTPSQLEILIAEGLLTQDFSLHLLLGGEPISEPTWKALQAAKNIHTYNVYGPTECTVDATICELNRAAGKPVIGKPIANVQTYILDQQLRPVPINVPGELHIGGAGLSRGYLNNPELTATKFISNPFGTGKLYKTGDIARHQTDGTLEYLGRVDHQVKLRGFRIELGEIEAALQQQPDIKQAVVTVRENTPGTQQIVAYVTCHEQTEKEQVEKEQTKKEQTVISELKASLQKALPQHMVPAAFIVLQALPLTANGKIARQALPAPKREAIASTFTAPRTPTESLLAQIWGNILAQPTIGIHDNFFELGGHSLLAAQVASRIRQRMMKNLPLRSLFEHPTIAALAPILDGLEQNSAPEQTTTPPILPAGDTVPTTLSFAQQRLWFLNQLEPDSSRYHITWAVRLHGELNVGALQKAIHSIVERHEVLRTHFVVEAGIPAIAIAPVPTSCTAIIDLSQSQTTLEATLNQIAQKPFNLSTDLLLRAAIIRTERQTEEQTEKQTHVLQIVIHHIATDGWSMEIFRRELSELYKAYSSEQPNPLLALPIQYSDFAHWQKQWLTHTVLTSQLNYWTQQLADAPPLLALPTDRPRPATPSYTGDRITFTISPALTTALKALSQQSNATLFMTLLAAFNTLLYRHTQQDDIVIGSPIANRNHAELEDLIGFFANTLALRTDLSGNPTFATLLNRVRQTALDAYAHQSLPFEKLVEELRPERSLSYTPLFQVLFSLQNTPRSDHSFANLHAQPQPVSNETAKFDLTLALEEQDDELQGVFKYNTDLFDASTIARLIGHFQTLLGAIAANPNQPLSTLPLLTKPEQQQLLTGWNQTEPTSCDYPTIHAWFEAQVEKTPNAIALVYETQQLTYRELNAKANQLAHHLQRLGVDTETLVGLCVDRSLDMMVGLLGILKAGGAYVPLDPVLPQQRLAFMLENAQATTLVTQSSLLPALTFFQGKTVCLDAHGPEIDQQSQQNLQKAHTNNLVYVLYTSGSTGQPKGVAVEHRQLLNYVQGILTRLQLPTGASYATVSTLAADLGNTVIFSALVTGGTLHILSQERITNPNAIATYFAQHPIDCLKIVPSHLAALLTATQPQNVLPRQRLLLGGEACSWSLIRQVKSLAPDCTVFNHYGPTETTVGVAACELQPADAAHSATPPIGRPLPNSQIYLLDAQQQLVPAGTTGELYIGGAGLTRGYLHRPTLTAQKFIPHPFSDSSHARLYKTGDLGRYLTDGRIELIGRIDSQIKVRGNRIELGEIEAKLSQHPNVQQCAVLAKADSTVSQKLVAYIATAPENNHSNNSSQPYRAYLQQTLPDCMVPSAFVSLPALPLTPNGKIDRKELLTLDVSATDLGKSSTDLAAQIAPRTSLEKSIAQVWQSVLGQAEIGIHDNFFDIGGHSLLAIHLMAQLQTQLGCDLPLSTLFQSPTVAQLAAAIETQGPDRKRSTPSTLVTLQAGSTNRSPIFFVHPVGGSVLCYADLVRQLDEEQPFYGLQSSFAEMEQAKRQNEQPLSLDAIAAHYITVLRTIQPEGPYLLGGWSMGGVVAFEMARQLTSQGHTINSLTLIDSHRPNPTKKDEQDSALLHRFAKHLALSKTQNLDTLSQLKQLKQTLQPLPFSQRLSELLIWLQDQTILHPDASKAQLQQLFDTFKRNFQAVNSYHPRPYSGPAHLFTCQEPISSSSQKQSAQTDFWQSVTADLTVTEVPANHFTLLHPPTVSYIAHHLKHIPQFSHLPQ